jgi:tetratricopeptide (TPR) repeat protein
VLAIEPASLEALGEAERLAAKLGREKELIPLYDELSAKNASASGGNNLGIAAELLTRAARLHVSLLGDREAAVKTWRRILKLDPANLDTARPAADALATLYAQIGDFAGFVEILRLQADWAGEESERADILRRVAEIEEKSLGDRQAAVATYRSLLDANDQDLGAMGELERLYELLGQHRERVDVMRRRLEVATSDEARRAVRFRMAVILERELSDVDEAISTVLGILDESSDNVAALEMLASLYDRKGAVNERLEILDRQLQLAGTREARAEILRGMAKLLEEPLGRPAEALERWREVLSLAENDPLAMERVEAMVARKDANLSLAAAEVLEPIYERGGQWSKLAGLIELYIKSTDDTRERMHHRIRLAKLQEQKLGDKQAALGSTGSAILDGLSEPQLPELLDSYERLTDMVGGDEPKRLVELYRMIEEDVFSDDVRLRIARVVAERAETLGDDALATEWHVKVLERAPDDVDVLTALERLYRRADNKPALLTCCKSAPICCPTTRPSRRPCACRSARWRWPCAAPRTPSRPTSACWRSSRATRSPTGRSTSSTPSKSSTASCPACSIGNSRGACPVGTRSSCTSGWPRPTSGSSVSASRRCSTWGRRSSSITTSRLPSPSWKS